GGGGGGRGGAGGRRREARLRALDGFEPGAQVVREPLVELVLVEVGAEVRRVVLVGGLGVVLVRQSLERALDPHPLGREKLACPVSIHAGSLRVGRLACVPPGAPTLSPAQLERIAGIGEERTAAVGDVLYRVGDATYPFIAIVE